MPDFSSTATLTVSEHEARSQTREQFEYSVHTRAEAAGMDAADDLANRAYAYGDAIRREAGRPLFYGRADATYDKFTSPLGSLLNNAAELRRNYRLRVNSPYWDSRLLYVPDALFYKDAYALYVSKTPADHPHILRATNGDPLYIPFGKRPYTQYAADITNPAFRARGIEEAQYKMALGYTGMAIDDVNYYRRVATAGGDEKGVQLGAAGVLTDSMWRFAMADFMAEIRDAFPDAEIAHNVKYYAPTPETPEVTMGNRQATWLGIEGGVIDPGITGGTGKFSLRALLDWVDRRHADGVGVIWDAQATTAVEREYQLAVYFLTSNGLDMLQGGTPGDWWSGYDAYLGAPLGPRLRDGGLHWREFERGSVWVVEPGGPRSMAPDGRTLQPRQGAVIQDA